MATTRTPTYTEHTRLPDALTAQQPANQPPTQPIDTVDEGRESGGEKITSGDAPPASVIDEPHRRSSSRGDSPNSAALPTETVQTSVLPRSGDVTNLVSFTDVPYPDLPPEHFFNRVTTYPVAVHDNKREHRIQPADVKTIIDTYSTATPDPDTGRLPTLNYCCNEQGFSRSPFLRRMQEEDEVRAYYERAQRIRADMLADELVEDASDDSNDLIEYKGLGGSDQVRGNSAAVKRDELIIKTKSMVMGHLNRPKYAPETMVKQNHLHLHGGVDRNPLEHPLAIADVDNLNVEDLFERQNALRRLPAP